jgi:hypothetical protein
MGLLNRMIEARMTGMEAILDRPQMAESASSIFRKREALQHSLMEKHGV